MSQTTRYTGDQLKVFFPTSTADISADYRTLEVTEEVGMVDSSAGLDTARYYKATKKDGSATLSTLDQQGTAGTAWWNSLTPGNLGTLFWAPEGTATGKLKRSATAIVKTRTPSVPYDDNAEAVFEFQFITTVADATW